MPISFDIGTGESDNKLRVCQTNGYLIIKNVSTKNAEFINIYSFTYLRVYYYILLIDPSSVWRFYQLRQYGDCINFVSMEILSIEYAVY